MEETELLLIRHGQTDLNREPRFQGQIDAPLNALGELQARRLAERLAGERIERLVCSDLTRTRQTAAPTAERLGLTVLPSAPFREQGFGVFEGLAFPEVIERYPQDWEAWLRHEAGYAPPGGESNLVFHARVIAALRAVAQAIPGGSAAVVTHGGVLDMVWRTARGLPLDGARSCAIPNAGINRIRVRGERIEILSWADDAHVADLTLP
ncbi:MAG: histidine phosphatase family protein [Gammaproteobacteria bacterium]